eukprot:1134734-Pelagomonas_calceolata.AAC.1
MGVAGRMAELAQECAGLLVVQFPGRTLWIQPSAVARFSCITIVMHAQAFQQQKRGSSSNNKQPRGSKEGK